MVTKANFRMVDGAAVNVLDFGAKGDGLTDDTQAIQAALDVGGHVIFPPSEGDYLVSDSLVVPSNTIVEWTSSYVRLTAPSSLGAMIYCSGFEDAGGNPFFKENVTFINPLLDGGNQGWMVATPFGENGLSASKCRNISIYGGHIKNIRYGTNSITSSGGKAINYEFGVENIRAVGVLIEDCSSALETSASPDGTPGGSLGVNRFSKDVHFADITVRNCGRVLRIARAESPTLGEDVTIMRGSARNIQAFNCGREDQGDALATAPVTLDRTTNWDIDITINNEDSYGIIDAPVKQRRGYNNRINIKFSGDANTLISHSQPSGAQINGTLQQNYYEVQHRGTVDYAVTRESGDTSLTDNEYNIYTDVLSVGFFNSFVVGYATFTNVDRHTKVQGRAQDIHNDGLVYESSRTNIIAGSTIINDVVFTDGTGSKVITTPLELKLRGENTDVMTLKANTVNFPNLQTSASGLSSGDIWNNAGVLNIVP